MGISSSTVVVNIVVCLFVCLLVVYCWNVSPSNTVLSVFGLLYMAINS